MFKRNGKPGLYPVKFEFVALGDNKFQVTCKYETWLNGVFSAATTKRGPYTLICGDTLEISDLHMQVDFNYTGNDEHRPKIERKR